MFGGDLVLYHARAPEDALIMPQVSPSGQHLLHLMLCPNPRERITVAEVMRHPWFQQDLPPPLLTINGHLTQVFRRSHHMARSCTCCSTMTTCSLQSAITHGRAVRAKSRGPKVAHC